MGYVLVIMMQDTVDYVLVVVLDYMLGMIWMYLLVLLVIL